MLNLEMQDIKISLNTSSIIFILFFIFTQNKMMFWIISNW